jgi:cardiolipin synthase (CMP-forming)
MRIINIPLTIPNAISLYRLYSFPFLMIFIFLGHKDLFAFFIWFNLTTDILDGWIARQFNQISEIGSRIDGIADSGTYILAITGIFVFKWADFQPFAVYFYIFLALFIISRIFSLAKLGIFHGYHSYIVKVTGYIHGIFFIVLFTFGFYEWFYFLMICSGYLAFIETILITMKLDEPRSDVKGFISLLKSRKS